MTWKAHYGSKNSWLSGICQALGCKSIISGATYDVRSVDLLESLGWKHLELRRNYLKSVFMYKILNNHTAPNLRTSFRLNNECDNTYDLRNRETDLSLPKPNTDSGKMLKI